MLRCAISQNAVIPARVTLIISVEVRATYAQSVGGKRSDSARDLGRMLLKKLLNRLGVKF